jgi:uncharacterized protein (DUF1800 family)
MARPLEENIAHLLRRAGFGTTPEELANYTALGYEGAVNRLVNYEQSGANLVDTFIGLPGYAPVVATNRTADYRANYLINDARARWLFRMLYTAWPLQEKMALFWHNHFATGYTKIAGQTNPVEATRLMAAVPTEDPAKQMGQIELFRAMALSNFADLLLEVTRDPAILYWLDGRQNTKAVPQENYGREVMELFTMGVVDATGTSNYTESDVKVAARVFTGWNLQATRVTTITIGNNSYPLNQYSFLYNSRNHDLDPKTFTFPIFPSGANANTIPARTATAGVQDGLDFLAALVRHPATATRLATKLYQFFVNDITPAAAGPIATIAGWLTSSGFNMRTVMGQLFLSDFFLDDANVAARYRWPVEHVIGALKTLGPGTTPLQNYLTPLAQMNEVLLDPPSVEGYKGGPNWFTSNTMLARANFGRDFAAKRDDMVTLATQAGVKNDPGQLVDFFLVRMGIFHPDPALRADLIQYVLAGSERPGRARPPSCGRRCRRSFTSSPARRTTPLFDGGA